MNCRTIIAATVLGMTLFAGATAQQPKPQSYDQRVALRGTTTIRTTQGPRTVGVTVSKIAVPGGVVATLELPEKGMVILQHRAGDVMLTVGETKRRLQEGEWVTIALPAKVTLTPEDDTALLDAIVVAE
jgi:hypothetical protein